ncbi:GNAT family N-acetyltransferase [Candidatus Gracilibacteria bacterium]|nr:GNAT family N-acetyltransferase [Candidatus Gracilibacteria bacterium]
MITRALFPLLQCPTCRSRQLYVLDDGIHCADCHSHYGFHDGYVDLMPRATAFGYISKYVSEEAELAEELDYRDLAPPLLAAGVRDRTLRRLLRFNKRDVVLDNGCGTAKHAVWNAPYVGLMVGSDPATLFADEALRQVALAKADSRTLPFADNRFDKAFAIDILEHFPLDVIDEYLAETARTLRPGGRMLAFSNTREMSPIQSLINISRRIGRWFVRAGVYDFEREARRKSDHLKALETWEDVLAAFERAGLRPVKVVFWNSLFTTFVEHVLMKLGEALLARQKTPGVKAKHPQPSPTTDGTAREIRARRRIRGVLHRSSPIYWALLAVTLLMELDLWLFGWMRCGSYFILVEKPGMRYRQIPAITFEDFWRLDSYAFREGYPRERYTAEDLAQLRGLYLGDELVAQLQLIPLQLQTGQGEVAAAGIGSVATAPEQRRRGYTAALLRHACDELRERAIHLAVLYPFKRSFYARYGWATLFERRSYRGSPALFARFQHGTGSFQRVGDEAIGELDSVYRRALHGRFGRSCAMSCVAARGAAYLARRALPLLPLARPARHRAQLPGLSFCPRGRKDIPRVPRDSRARPRGARPAFRLAGRSGFANSGGAFQRARRRAGKRTFRRPAALRATAVFYVTPGGCLWRAERLCLPTRAERCPDDRDRRRLADREPGCLPARIRRWPGAIYAAAHGYTHRSALRCACAHPDLHPPPARPQRRRLRPARCHRAQRARSAGQGVRRITTFCLGFFLIVLRP